MKRHTAPIIAALLLLLPVLYVGSYLALVVPGRGAWQPNARRSSRTLVWHRYRFGGQASEVLFWPLEKIDRKLRPGAWGFVPERIVGPGVVQDN